LCCDARRERQNCGRNQRHRTEMDGSHDGPTSLLTEVTPNLCSSCLRDSHAQDILCVVWNDAASARPSSRLRRRDLDSEGDNERSFFEQSPPPRLEAGAQVSRRRGQSEPGNNEGVLRVRRSGGAPRVLANKRDRPDDGASAIVDGAHARGRR
jgi:hypothetical protein